MTSPPRWVGVGHAADADSRRAATRATDEALRGSDPALLLVLAGIENDHQAVMAGVTACAPGVPLIGCSTAGELTADGVADGSVLVIALGGAGFSAATGSASIGADAGAAGLAAAACIDDLPDDGRDQVLVLLGDGLAPNKDEVVRGAYGMVGAGVAIVGGFAGDQMRFTQTVQYHDGRVLHDAVVTAAIASDGHLGIGVSHGWRRVGEPMVVTSVDDAAVLTLDHRPAVEVFLERCGVPLDMASDEEAMQGLVLTRPLGLTGPRGDEARHIGWLEPDRGALMMAAPILPGSTVWLMEGDHDTTLAAGDTAAAAALEALGGSDPLGLLVFDCAARRWMLGTEGVAREVERIGKQAPDALLAGLHTYGEVARLHGMAGVHNQTAVVVAVG